MRDQITPLRPRRFKLEFYDPDGVKHSLTVDGQVTREKVGKLLDLVEIIAGSPRATASMLQVSPRKFDRLASTIFSELKSKDFTSTEAKKAYETSFNEKIGLSTVSTYLGRLVDRGVLERTHVTQNVHYKLMAEDSKPLLALRPETRPV